MVSNSTYLLCGGMRLAKVEQEKVDVILYLNVGLYDVEDGGFAYVVN